LVLIATVPFTRVNVTALCMCNNFVIEKIYEETLVLMATIESPVLHLVPF